MLKTVLSILAWALLAAYFFVALGFTLSEDKKQKFKKIQVKFNEKTEFRFITAEEVLDILKKNNTKIIGKTIDNVSKDKIEKKLKKNIYIKNAEVYSNCDNKLIIKIWQRKPVLRIFTARESYYVDDEKEIIPISDKHTAHVHIITGKVNKKMVVDEIFDLIKYIRKNEFWNAQVDHVEVIDNQQVILIPKVGVKRIFFGKIENIQQKFDNLFALYKQALPIEGWEKYKQIDLRYKNQIVCTKK